MKIILSQVEFANFCSSLDVRKHAKFSGSLPHDQADSKSVDIF